MSRLTDRDALLNDEPKGLNPNVFKDFTDNTFQGFEATVYPNMICLFKQYPYQLSNIGMFCKNEETPLVNPHPFYTDAIDPNHIFKQLCCQVSAYPKVDFENNFIVKPLALSKIEFNLPPLFGKNSKTNYDQLWKNMMIYAVEEKSSPVRGIATYAPTVDLSKILFLSALPNFDFDLQFTATDPKLLSDFTNDLSTFAGQDLSSLYHIAAYDWEKLFPQCYLYQKDWSDYTLFIQDFIGTASLVLSGDPSYQLSDVCHELGKAYLSIQTVIEDKKTQEYEVPYIDVSQSVPDTDLSNNFPTLSANPYAWPCRPYVDYNGNIALSNNIPFKTNLRTSMYNYLNLMDWYYTYLVYHDSNPETASTDKNKINRLAQVPLKYAAKHMRLLEYHRANMGISISTDINTNWHYDDVANRSYLSGIGTWYFDVLSEGIGCSEQFPELADNTLSISRVLSLGPGISDPVATCNRLYWRLINNFYTTYYDSTLGETVVSVFQPYLAPFTMDTLSLAISLFPKAPEDQRAEDLANARELLSLLCAEYNDIITTANETISNNTANINDQKCSMAENYLDIELRGNEYYLWNDSVMRPLVIANQYVQTWRLAKDELDDLAPEIPDIERTLAISDSYDAFLEELNYEETAGNIKQWRIEIEEAEAEKAEAERTLVPQIEATIQKIWDIEHKEYTVKLPDMRAFRDWGGWSYWPTTHAKRDEYMNLKPYADAGTNILSATELNFLNAARNVIGPIEQISANWGSGKLLNDKCTFDWPAEKLVYGYKAPRVNQYVFSKVDYNKVDRSISSELSNINKNFGYLDAYEDLAERLALNVTKEKLESDLVKNINTAIPEYSNGFKEFYGRDLLIHWSELVPDPNPVEKVIEIGSIQLKPSIWASADFGTGEYQYVYFRLPNGTVERRIMLKIYFNTNSFTTLEFAQSSEKTCAADPQEFYWINGDSEWGYIKPHLSDYWEGPDYKMLLQTNDTTYKSMSMNLG